MKVVALVLFAAMLANSELTKQNFDAAVDGKTMFIMFMAPWHGECKAMKPAWDKLMEEFKDSKTALVEVVDCTAAGKDLCGRFNVNKYPNIKYGRYVNDLEEYKEGKDFDSLKKFAEETLVVCSPANPELCDDVNMALIEKFTQMSPSDLAAAIQKKLDAAEVLDANLKEVRMTLMREYEDIRKRLDVDTFQDREFTELPALTEHLHQQLKEAKEKNKKDQEELKRSGENLELMKAVKAHRKEPVYEL